jgi:PAS domain S-box-containing protein
VSEPQKIQIGVVIDRPPLQESTVNADSLSADAVGILNTIDIPVVMVDRTCKVARFNRAAAESLGASVSDVARPAREMRAMQDSPELDKICLQVMADEVPYRFEMRNSDRWFLVRVAPSVASDGRVRGAVLTFTNITAFRASLGQAVYEREYTKTILNAVTDPLVVLDERMQVQTANRAFYDWFGISREQSHGTPLATLGDDDWRASPLWASLSATLAGSEGFQTIEVERDYPGAGRRIVLLDARALIRDSAALILLSFRDITSRKRAEASLREVDRRKDEFLATLAHELRNPLAPIRQASAISRAATATAEQKHWSHEVIDRQVKHMGLLLEDLLDVSRITRGTLSLRPQTTTLTSIIEAAIETARPTIEAKRHTLNIEIADEPARFVADPLRLSQVLSNLLTNAAKYTDPGGEIRLRASCDSDTVTFSVADNGIGIPPQAIAEVFSMFSQVKSAQDRSEGGLGIGLALAKGLLELHEGTLEVRSEGTGRGSEFTAKLPRKTPDVTPGEVASPTNFPSIRRRVLIADDNNDAADSLAVLLRMEGHEVTVAYDGEHALSAIESLRPEVAVLDIGMPGLDGYEVARKVRSSPTSTSVTLVAVTGWGQALDKARAIEAGFDHHFTKPIEVEVLAKMLCRV